MNQAGIPSALPSGQGLGAQHPTALGEPGARFGRWLPVVVPAAAGAGAVLAVAVPLWVMTAPGAMAVWWYLNGRRLFAGLALVCAVGGSCTALSASAWRGLDAPLPESVDGRVQLTKDPRPIVRGVRVEVRHNARRYDAFVRGAPAGVMVNLRAGETVELTGQVIGRDASDRWRASRHVSGLIEVSDASRPASAHGLWAIANAVHRAMANGSQDLPPAQRGVLLGVSVGDRAALPAAVGDDLRAAGLSHLTAVSGQHVALLMAMVAPVVGRIAVRPRVFVVAMVLAAFVVLTRGEPSVLRAVTMALAVEVARSGGQRVRGGRVLGMTVAVLLIIDPLLVWSVAFQLSVAATAGIALGASRLAARLPGPRYVANLLAMGICAQLAVAPLAVLYFGHVPITGVMANLVVAPVIGVMMGWGLTAGVLTGITGIGSNVVHLPTLILGGWLVSVAGWFASLPIGHARPVHVAAVAATAVLMMVAGKRSWPVVRPLGALVVVVVLLVAAAVPHGPAPGRHEVAVGAEVVVGTERSVVAMDGRAEIASVLSGLRKMGVLRVAAVVSRTGSVGSVGTAAQICERLGPCTVLVPGGSAGAAAALSDDASLGVEVIAGQRVLTLGGSQFVTIGVDGERLSIQTSGPSGGAVG